MTSERIAKPAAVVRVFLCTYRRRALLPRALESLLGQTMAAWKCELHNDAPDDPFPAELVASLGDSRVELVQHSENLGGVVASNLVFDPRPERYVSLLEDDNWWEPRFLERMVAEMDARPQVTVGWANIRIWRESPGGTWEDTGRTEWPETPGAVPELFHWPRFDQSWRALHSTGAMLCRSGNLGDFKVPAGARLDFIEPIRERAMPHPLLLVPEPLANYAMTIRTARPHRLEGLSEHYTLLLVSYFRHVRPGADAIRSIWEETRRMPVRSTDKLILAGLAAPECRGLLGPARAAEWFRFLRAQLRRPRLFLRALGARRHYPEVWRYLDRHTRSRCAAIGV